MLKDTHFPGNTEIPPQPLPPLAAKVDIRSKEVDFITPERIKACINSFKPRKGAGPSGLKPAVFQHFGNKALVRLANLYKASYLLGKQPECFKTVRIIFIPKPGRPDYSVAKAHRPISLMNFIMKIMEKFLLWHHEDTILKDNPLEGEQHGFTKAKSCDSAITNIVSHVEMAMIRDEYSVLALLDVEGAFDNATYQSMLQPLREKGTPINYISWIQDFLQCRKSTMDVKGVHRDIYHTRGTPQGGCSSPYLWNCVVNELIKAIKPLQTLHIVCYADDVAMTCQGPDLADCIKRLQEGLDAVVQWAQSHSLSMSHSKSEIMILTKKRKYFSIVESVPQVKLGPHPVPYAFGSIRYLGVWLDRKLDWTDHVRTKCAKVKKLLMKAITSTGSGWGLKPYQGRYFWEALGRTVLTFGCLAWQHACRKKSIRNRLRSIQRLGFKLMAPFRRGTPTSGLELIFNCPPVEVYVKRMATKAYFRTLQHAPYTVEQMKTTVTSRISHRSWIHQLICDQGLDYLEGPLDEVPLHRRWDRKFRIDEHSMSLKNLHRGRPDLRGVAIYTDGSKNSKGNTETGAGVAILDGGNLSIDSEGAEQIYSYHLGRQTTVFQSELFAQKMAANLIINSSADDDGGWVCGRPVTIYSDSQASILALKNIWVKSLLVQQTLDLLDQAAGHCKELTIKWVQAHEGYKGNELADRAAKQGRDSPAAPDWETPLLAKAVMHSEIDKMVTRLWEQTWDEVIGCRQTRYWFPKGPRKDFVKDIAFLSKTICGQLIQLVTGHTYLKRHQAIIDESERQRIIQITGNTADNGEEIIDAPDPTCSLCHQGEETPQHFLSDCEALGTLRLSIFGKEELVAPGEIPDFSDLPVHKVVSFFREAGRRESISSLSMRPHMEENIPTDLPGVSDNQSLKDRQKHYTAKGNKLMASYLYHM